MNISNLCENQYQYEMLSLVVEKHDDLWTKLHIGKCCAATMLHHSPTSSEERRVNPVNPLNPHWLHTVGLLLVHCWFSVVSPMIHYPGILNILNPRQVSRALHPW